MLTQVQIQDKAEYVSHNADIFGKVMKLSTFPLAMGK